MANAVLIQNPSSIYDDRPGEAYNFPRNYLNMIEETVGDWVIFYEGRTGAFGYVAVQKVVRVVADRKREGWYFALLDPSTLLQFETLVPRADRSGIAYEIHLRGPDGRPFSGGVNTSAVRRITPAEFAAIVATGLAELPDADADADAGAMPRRPDGFGEAQGAFTLPADRHRLLTDRAFRDASFARMVKRAYGGRCAISGLSLRNGGGRPEVQAAHIRPVAERGPDVVRNGLALSGTLHWMFDRGLISVAGDHSILVSHNKVDVATTRRLLHPGGRLILPERPRDYPHPDYLRWHRENRFGQVA